MEEQKKSTDSWDEYVSGDFLKSINVTNEQEEFVCVNIEETETDDRKVLRMKLERNGNSWDFDLNKTNAAFLKENGIETPSQVVGKKISFKKVLVRNPQTNKEVEGLRINKVA